MNFTFPLPPDVLTILHRLQQHGYQGYAVGGCVRDALMGLTPKDYDIATDAPPEAMQAIFSGYHTLENGLKHGTLTVILHHTPYEVTTFRVDGDYADHRHPNGVTFVRDLREDLARRDLTINAMAYHPETGLSDPFHGQEDLQKGLIRAVGEAEKRFEEDALRILRALRFAARYNFPIEERTAQAALSLAPTLSMVAMERIRVELDGILMGPGAGKILREFAPVFAVILPEMKPLFGLDQRNPHHRYHAYEHTCRAVDSVRPLLPLRYAMLLHDVGKPDTMTVDDKGVGHFYGHGEVSARKAKAILTRLRMDNKTAQQVEILVRHHDLDIIPTPKILKRRLHLLGEDTLFQLLQVQCADRIATGTREKSAMVAEMEHKQQALRELLAASPCYSLKTLAVTGEDMIACGIPKGKPVGEALNTLLTRVIEETLPNEREALLEAARGMAPS